MTNEASEMCRVVSGLRAMMRFGAARVASGAALALVACGPSIAPALTAANPYPTPFVGSVFTQCTVYVTDSGRPGRSLQQQEFEVSTNKIGLCPQYIVLSNPMNYDSGLNWHAVFNNSASDNTLCTYTSAQSPDDNFALCKLTPSTGPAPPGAGVPATS